MAAQNANPEPWDDSMADGCSGVFNLGYRKPCCRHDHRYYLGGDAEDKAFADDMMYQDMKDPRWVMVSRLFKRPDRVANPLEHPLVVWYTRGKSIDEVAARIRGEKP